MADILAKGVDISSYQGKDIDFKKLKAAGYSFVIIKAGQGVTEMNTFRKHPEYRYLSKVKDAGLDWGAYWWSDAVSPSEAKQEAEAFVETLDGLKPTYPVYLDQEYDSPCGVWGPGKNKQLRTDMANAFLETLEAAGYYAGLYSSTDWLKNYVDDTQLTKWDKWVAQYASACTYPGSYGMWQHTVVGTKGKRGADYFTYGTIPGFTANCDENYCYRDYPEIIKAHGLNGWKPAAPDAAPPDYEALYRKSANALSKIEKILNEYKGA